MRILKPRTDFVIVEDYFSAEQAAEWLDFILKKGEDLARGFHHPDVKPNRFHKAPKYPVKKFMCFGLYWNPLDYLYYPVIPATGAKPHPIPQFINELCTEALRDFFSWERFSPESVLVNFYTENSSMGQHIDKDEDDKVSPVIGVNFGSTCRFLFEDEHSEIKEIRIPGNSIYIFGGEARQMRHGIGSIYSKTLSAGSESYLENKERINLTIRQIYPRT